MIFGLKGVFIGQQTKVSSKGNSYTVASISNGCGEVLTSMLNKSDCLSDLELYKEYNFLVDYDVRYKNIKILGVSK